MSNIFRITLTVSHLFRGKKYLGFANLATEVMFP